MVGKRWWVGKGLFDKRWWALSCGLRLVNLIGHYGTSERGILGNHRVISMSSCRRHSLTSSCAGLRQRRNSEK